jgi:hypothetical protein
MSLRRVGGAGDGGVDLRGWWWIPADAAGEGSDTSGDTSGIEGEIGRVGGKGEYAGVRRVRVVGQCKAERKSLGPRALRELEGVMAHLRGEHAPALLPPEDLLMTLGSTKGKEREADLIAVLLSQSGFSRNAMTHAARSGTPLMLVHLPGGQPVMRQPVSDADDLEESSEKEEGEMLVEGAWWNSALAGKEGVLGGRMELRREILVGSGRNQVTKEPEVKARVGVWFDGRRFTRVGPPLEEE